MSRMTNTKVHFWDVSITFCFYKKKQSYLLGFGKKGKWFCTLCKSIFRLLAFSLIHKIDDKHDLSKQEGRLTGVGLGAPHFFMLHTVLKEKLTFSHLGQTQSPSEDSSGPEKVLTSVDQDSDK